MIYNTQFKYSLSLFKRTYESLAKADIFVYLEIRQCLEQAKRINLVEFVYRLGIEPILNDVNITELLQNCALTVMILLVQQLCVLICKFTKISTFTKD